MEVGFISVAVILLIFAVGFFLTREKLWHESTSLVCSQVIVLVSAPCLALTSIYQRFTSEQLLHSLILLLVGLIHISILFGLSKILSFLLKLSPKKKEVFEVTFTFSNTIFIGLPVTQIVFGSKGLPYMFIYYIVILILFWSLGAYKIAKLSDKGGVKKISLKKIINPGLIGCILGSFLVLTGIKLPSVFSISLDYLSDLTVPLSLLVIGANLAVIFKNGIPKIELSEIIIMICKFIISPALMFLIIKLFNITGLPMSVLIFISAMPCHMQTSILAEFYDIEPKYASKLVGLSTVLCLFTIPIFAWILQIS
ncbi:MAG: AEC family transporter [Clostridiales Family XIII bacterium]|nr:AEC family transporter [Clostridiales Family XIII bacterium]